MDDVIEMVDTLNSYYLEVSRDDKEALTGLSDNPLDDRCIDTIKEMLDESWVWGT